MDVLSFETVFKLLADLSMTLPHQSKAAIEHLRGELESLEFAVKLTGHQNKALREQVDHQSREIAGLRRRYDELSTDEFAATGYVWRKTSDGGRVGPCCPIHRDVLLRQVDDRWMGMFCTECQAAIPDQTLSPRS